MNWRKIKAEYIAGGISQRALAEKHNIPWGTLQRRARVEKWNAKRQKAEDKTVEKLTQKTAEKTADIASDNAATVQRIKAKILARVEGMIDNFPETNAGEMRKQIGHIAYIYKMKDLASICATLEESTATVNVDIEDLSPLMELLRDE